MPSMSNMRPIIFRYVSLSAPIRDLWQFVLSGYDIHSQMLSVHNIKY